MLDVKCDYFFRNFLYSANLDLDLEVLVEECVLMKSNSPSVMKSNVGGWQSEGDIHLSKTKSIVELNEKITNFVNFVASRERLGFNLGICGGWVNINQAQDCNVVHFHGKTDVIAVFYAAIPEKSGPLVFVRTDGAAMASTFRNTREQINFILEPEVGRVYVFPSWVPHYVRPSPGMDGDRISISYNYIEAINGG